jgi:hypothetical protein
MLNYIDVKSKTKNKFPASILASQNTRLVHVRLDKFENLHIKTCSKFQEVR